VKREAEEDWGEGEKALNRTRRMMVVALVLLANPAMAATVVVPGVGARTAVPCCGNNPRAPRVYVPGPNNGPPIEPHYNAPRPFFAPRQAPSPMLQRRVVP
jgi:hypothetical protein